MRLKQLLNTPRFHDFLVTAPTRATIFPLTFSHLRAMAGFAFHESLHHHLVTLPAKLQAPAWCHYGVEKHMKSKVDQMFGWLNMWIARAKRNGATIFTLEQLVKVAKEESTKQVSTDAHSSILVLH